MSDQVSASTEQASVLRGVVVNAMTAQPISRALVRMGSQAILTQHDGKFEFSGLSGTSTSLNVSKPGFYQGADGSQRTLRVAINSSGEPVEVRLYPEALITGTLIGPDGDPLSQINVQAFERTVDEAGPHWKMAAQINSDADGEFRLPLPGGDYVLETRYSQERAGLHEAVLPIVIPEGGAAGQSASASMIHLASGAEQHFDLRPKVRDSHAVRLQIDGTGDRYTPQLEVHLSNGSSFVVPTRRTENPGEISTSLPSGTFTLSSNFNEGEGAIYGETRVAVGDHDVSGVVLHLNKITPIPVEVTVDPASTSDNSSGPSIAEFGLFFSRTNTPASAMNQNIYVSQGRNITPSVSLLPGTYGLGAQASGTWFIESANFGGTDLFTHDLAVDAATSGTPIRIVVSNQTATIKSVVTMGDQPAASWVYLVATTPSATPVIVGSSGADGSFTRLGLAPGTYRAVAFEDHRSADFSDPAVLEKLASYVQTVTTTPGETATVNLTAVPASEAKQ